MTACRLHKICDPSNSYSSTLNSPGEALSCSKFIKHNIAMPQQNFVGKLALLPIAMSTNCTSGKSLCSKQTWVNMQCFTSYVEGACSAQCNATPATQPGPDHPSCVIHT
jgi:hypothetical protein